MLTVLYTKLLNRKKTLEQDTLTHPPSDYSGLMKTVGAYDELLSLIQEVENIMKGKEDE